MRQHELIWRGLLLVTLGCVGCEEGVASGLEQGVNQGERGDGGLDWLRGDAGILVPSGIVPRDGGGGLTTRPPPGDAGVEASADAGQRDASSDAGPVDAGQQVVKQDAGPLLDADGGSIDPHPTPNMPACSTLFYRDLDADGFGDAKFAVVSCTQPAGYVLKAGDCYDGNERAFPGAVGQFMVHRGDGSFDYDCDSKETQARPNFAVCPSFAGACAPDDLECDDHGLSLTWPALEEAGWTDFRAVRCEGGSCPTNINIVPRCGETGFWGLNVSWNVFGAKYACTMPILGTTRIQTCR